MTNVAFILYLSWFHVLAVDTVSFVLIQIFFKVKLTG